MVDTPGFDDDAEKLDNMTIYGRYVGPISVLSIFPARNSPQKMSGTFSEGYKSLLMAILYRCLYGAKYRRYNNYQASACAAIRDELFPMLHKQVDIWFDELADEAKESQNFVGGQEEAIRRNEKMISDKMLEANMLRREIRILRDSLLR